MTDHEVLNDDTLRKLSERRMAMRVAAVIAAPALERLVHVMKMKTGQSYKVRAFLYSMFNGKPASLLEAIGLDLPIRQDLALVWLGFGYEGTAGGPSMFYDAIKNAVAIAGLWGWFVCEGDREVGL